MSDAEHPTRVGGAVQQPAADAALYSGTLRRGEHRDTIVGELVDSWGWRIELRGIRRSDGSYALTGKLGGAVPDAVRVPAIDGEKGGKSC